MKKIVLILGVWCFNAQALISFNGDLSIPEFKMTSTPEVISATPVLGKDPQMFPAVKLSFITYGKHIVPLQRDIILTNQGTSFWDVITAPGRIDRRTGAASFPIVLMNRLEGESHNGVVKFTYDGTNISPLNVEITQQGTPWYVSTRFTVTDNKVAATYQPRRFRDRSKIIKRFQAELAHQYNILDWEAFGQRYGNKYVDTFDGDDKPEDLMASALVMGKTVYTSGCNAMNGKFPHCRYMHHGLWSVTKSLVGTVALLRLAQKYGPEVYKLKIKDFVKVTATHTGWDNVTFENAADMASGIGHGTTVIDPNNIDDGYEEQDPLYDLWYVAPTLEEKLEINFREVAYPWGPGKVARYRDQDPMVLGVAMDRFLKSKEGNNASLWKMLQSEVYQPLGIALIPMALVPSKDDSENVPLTGFGAYATLEDMGKVGRLFHDLGMVNGVQILDREKVIEIMRTKEEIGFRTGYQVAGGEVRYKTFFWRAPFDAGACKLQIPMMEGFGGNIVALFPNGMTGIRMRHKANTTKADWDPIYMARLANRVKSFCNVK